MSMMAWSSANDEWIDMETPAIGAIRHSIARSGTPVPWREPTVKNTKPRERPMRGWAHGVERVFLTRSGI